MAPAAAAMSCRHAFNGLPGAEKGAAHIGGEDPVDAGGVHLLQPHLRLQNAGIVHQHIEGSQFFVAGLKQPQDIRFHRDVGLNGDCIATGFGDFGDDCLGPVGA